MKYTTELIISLPRAEVIKLFDNTENLYKWQEGLLSFELIEGEAAQEGTLSRMVYAGRKGDLHMTETITKRNFPDEFSATYKAKGVFNVINNYFTEQTPGQTTWKMVNVFRFRGLMALMAPFMKSAFEANTVLNMERFRAFAEQTELPENHSDL
ncbi:MAG: SRPBCC family protein [Bacteroidetes bacterium]|nr:SRPBCC family protein [Bacteroidota bacterium]